MDNDKSLNELLDSINSSIDDIRKNPTKTEKIPGTLEILISGISGNKELETLFSPKLDEICMSLIRNIESGNFEKILNNTDSVKKVLDNIFGEKSFQGPVSTEVINSIQRSVNSEKYLLMKSKLGNVVTLLKKKRLIIRNLEKSGLKFKDDKETLKKYKESVYAIKQVLKIIEKIYLNRKIVNKKVFNGLKNIVHESELK